MALLSLADRRKDAPGAEIGAPLWSKATAMAAGAFIVGLAAIWTGLAPTRPAPLNFASDADFAAASARGRAAPAGFEAEIEALYAGVEGPATRRYSGVDTRILTMRSGDTLSAMLQRAGATRDDAAQIVKAVSGVYDPRQIRQGLSFTITLGVPEPRIALRAAALPASTADSDRATRTDRVRVMSLSFRPDVDREIVARRNLDGGYDAQAIQKKLTAQLYRASGVIDASLFMSTAAAGVPDRVTSNLMRLFSYDVDFQRDIHSGDGFEVFFTRYFDENGATVKTGDILFAALTLQGERKALYRHQREPGREPEYFDANGKSIKKSFLRTPIESARVSSGFGMRRHPILGYSKMHKGIDFAAPTGTPVLASGDGAVELAGRAGGYGNYIRIRHTADHKTAYAHLSGYARGIKTGVNVTQGQVIGYVGSTGRSTGPHLHYEIMVNGAQVNPANVKLDTNQPLTGPALAAFRRAKEETDALMAKTPANAPVETAEADLLAVGLRGGE